MQKETISIHIDKQKYDSPEDTTGQALYILGSVPADFDLFLEVPGPGADLLIPRNENTFKVKESSHFYTAKQNLNPGNE